MELKVLSAAIFMLTLPISCVIVALIAKIRYNIKHKDDEAEE